VRIAVISDIHANLAALEAVSGDWGAVDAVWCLGDIVGYGPDPSACLEKVRELTTVCVAGNHDWAATGRIDTADFNWLAAEAAAWTNEQLSDDDISYLNELPETLTSGEYTLVHGSPRGPTWEYVTSVEQAVENFFYFEGSTCFIGHTHVPNAFSASQTVDLERMNIRREAIRYDEPVKLGRRRHLVNVGSVGQPRDGDYRASYLVLDLRTREYCRRRVNYDVARTQERMRQVGLPGPLAARLSIGR
jgi:predicted phosphodiesterase